MFCPSNTCPKSFSLPETAVNSTVHPCSVWYSADCQTQWFLLFSFPLKATLIHPKEDHRNTDLMTLAPFFALILLSPEYG